MPSLSGFGLGDAPFTTSGFGSFDELSRSVARGNSSASSSSSSAGGGFFDSFLGTLGGVVERAADFGTKLFIYDELAERGQTSTTNHTTTNTGTGGTATIGSSSSSFIKGISNEMLLIGGGVALLLLMLFMKVK